MRALPELEGRLVEALPVRPLALAEGLLLTVGLVRLVLLPTRPVEALPAVGRLDMLPSVRPVVAPLLTRPDMLPALWLPWRPSFAKLWLKEPLTPLLPCRTLAT